MENRKYKIRGKVTMQTFLHSCNQYLSNTNAGKHCLDEQDGQSLCSL